MSGMPSKIWLPTGRKPFPTAKDEKETLINRLWELKYAVPGAKGMEVQQLKDYVQFAEERVAEDEEAAKKEEAKARKKMDGMSQDQVIGAMKEYLNWRARKRGEKGKYPKQ